jgi:hypothetical protein
MNQNILSAMFAEEESDNQCLRLSLYCIQYRKHSEKQNLKADVTALRKLQFFTARRFAAVYNQRDSWTINSPVWRLAAVFYM